MTTGMRATPDATGAGRKARYSRLVAKIGTNVLTAGSERLDEQAMASLVEQVARLHSDGAEVIVVTSGAVAAGRHRLEVTRERKDVPFRQTLAAVGQSNLMQAYDRLFAEHGIVVAQTLLTKQDLADRVGYLNARNTLLSLLSFRVVPIVNENDVVAVDELEGANIGDNDNLSALVANLVDAQLLAMLTDTGGLHTADPRLDPGAKLITRVERIDEEIQKLAAARGPSPIQTRGVGGMATKLQAAKLATAGGADVAIASGHERDILPRLAAGEAVGTTFPASVDRMESRKRWMLAGLSQKGSIAIDDGAIKALRHQRRSLLAAGVRDVDGSFARGDAVAIADDEGRRVACGIVNYDAADIVKIRGMRSSRIEEALGYQYGDEVVHRNNLVLL